MTQWVGMRHTAKLDDLSSVRGPMWWKEDRKKVKITK